MGAEAWESRIKRYLGAFLGARYAQDRGLGFSPEAVPSWDASALFRIDKGGPWPCYKLSTTCASTREEITKICRDLCNWELSSGVPDDSCERLLALCSISRSKYNRG